MEAGYRAERKMRSREGEARDRERHRTQQALSGNCSPGLNWKIEPNAMIKKKKKVIHVKKV